MKFLLKISLLTICSFCFAQNNTIKEIKKDTLVNLTKIKKIPNGGLAKFYKYITDNFSIPNDSSFSGGKEIVEFTIKADGTVGEIKIIKDIGYGVGEQIKKILKNSSKWSPGVKDGKPIDCTYTIPIKIYKNFEE